MSSSHNMLFRRIAVMLFGLDKSAGGLKEVIDRLSISLYCCRPKNLLVIVVDATLDILDVDGHDLVGGSLCSDP
jgi:hypothetical protein